jgi:Spy/CpxP family protein refolding chaperone
MIIKKFSLFLLAGFLISQPVFASSHWADKKQDKVCQDCKKWDHEKMEDHFLKMKNALKLSSDQVVKIEEIGKKYKLQYESIKTSLNPLRQQIKDEVEKDNVNQDQLKSLLEKEKDLKIKMKLLQIQQREEVRQLLTDEQKELAKKMREKMRNSMNKRSSNDEEDNVNKNFKRHR